MSDQAATNMKGDELASMLKSEIVFKDSDSVKCEALKLSTQDMAWWRDVKFGMFIHWGLYAIPAKGEWHMHSEKVSASEYAKLADEFTPRNFDAAEWVRIAKDAGMRYMVLTARHHDGYALWDSPASYGQYCSAKTAAKRDFIAEYTAACHSANMRVGLYYSPMDWRFPGYFQPKEMPENIALMKEQCYGQVQELMQNYGPIDVLWYDGGWLAHKGTDADAAWLWEPMTLNTMVRKHQPKVAISPRSGWEGDFGCNEGGKAVDGPIIPWPWEKCLNLNQPAWGYHTKQDLMSFDEIIRMLVNVVGRGGNVLLNVGPDRDGVIPPTHVERLREVGAWLQKNGTSIYGTRAGPFQPVTNQYCTTYRGTSVYVHVFAGTDSPTLTLPPLAAKIISCSLMAGGKTAFTQTGSEVTVTIPANDRPSPVTVIELMLEKPI